MKAEIRDRQARMSAVTDRFKSWRPAREVLTKVIAQPTCFVQLDGATRCGGWPIQRFGLVHGPSNHGKAQPIDEPVLTPEGWVAIGTLNVGDYVVGASGKATRVTGVYPQGERKIFQVMMDDGGWTRCCGEHLWFTTTANELNHGRYRRGPRPERKRIFTGRDGRGSVKECRQIAMTLSESHYVPMVEPVRMRAVDLAIDPYILGLLLGDGSFRGRSIRFTSADEELHEALGKWVELYGDIYNVNGIEGRVTGGERGNSDGSRLMWLVEELGMRGHRSEEKLVPPEYLYADADQRLALLQGLMDTDGSPPTRKSGGAQCQFSTTSIHLRDAMMWLARSLGGRARWGLKKTDSLDAYSVMVSGLASPFRLKRKQSKLPKRRLRKVRRRIVDIESVGVAQCVCIKVEAEDQLYVTRDFIVTHNTAFVLGLGLSFLQAGHFFALVDAEYTTPDDWLQKLMADSHDDPGFVAMRPHSYDETVEGVREFVNTIARARAEGDIEPETSGLIVVDSLNKLVPEKLLNKLMKGEGSFDGADGRAGMMIAAINNQWLKELTPQLYHTRTALVVIAREYARQKASMFDHGPDYTVAGGRGIEFESSLTCRVSRAGFVKRSKDGPVIGEKHRVTIRKTKVGGKEEKAETAHFYTSNGVLIPEGFDRARGVVEEAIARGVVHQKGSSYTWSSQGEILGRGVNAVVKSLHTDQKTLMAIEEEVRDVIAKQQQ